MSRRFFLLCLAVVAGVVFPESALAFQVSPAIQEVNVAAGTTVDRDIQLVNTDEEPVELFFTVQKFGAGGGGAPVFLSPNDVSGLPEWIRVSQPAVRIEPRSTASIQVRVVVPKDARPGSYTAAIFATESIQSGMTVDVAKRIATLWFVTVKGADGTEPRRAWQIEEVSYNARADRWRTVTDVGARLKNTGEAHGIAVATVTIDGLFSQPKSVQRTARLLPLESRDVNVEFSSLIPFERARIAVELASGERVERVIWIAPFRSVFVFLIVCFAAVGGWQWRKHRRRGILRT